MQSAEGRKAQPSPPPWCDCRGAHSQSLQSGSLGSCRRPKEVGSNSLMSPCPSRKCVLPESSAAQEPQLKVSYRVLPNTSPKCCVSKQFLLPASPFIKKQVLVPFNNPLPFLDISLNHAAKLSEPLPRINYFSSFSPLSLQPPPLPSLKGTEHK